MSVPRVKSVPSANLEDRSLGTGNPTSSSRRAGKQKAVWSAVNLTTGTALPAGSVIEVDVPHTLGKIPTVVELDRWENAAVPDTFIQANGVRPENWSHSHAHANVRLISGSLDGCVAHFLVKGR